MSDRQKIIGKYLDEYLENKSGKFNNSLMARLNVETTRNQFISSLEDGTVFSIVESLRDLQELRESDLWKERQENLKNLMETGADTEYSIKELDRRILEQIDKIADEQQCTLIAAGLTIFHQSKTEEELRFQMAVIDFILTLKDVFESEN